MPRIRKKTSRRQSTAQRAKITRKAGETRKKNKKAEKKNPQWKSKKKADPGIPNSFPYKDQILAEVAEERRQEEAAKIARKEAARSKPEEKEEDTPGIASLHSSSVYTATRETDAGSSSTQAEDEVPALVDTSLATLQDVLDRADVVLQVVDARDIAGGRNAWIEGLVKDVGVYGMIVNKADLVPREALESWLPVLPTNTFLFSAPQFPIASASTSKPKPHGRSELLAKLEALGQGGTARDGDLRVALVGLPSVGKTSILNALLPASSPNHTVAPPIPPVSSAKAPGPTTKTSAEVSLELGDDVIVKVIDTPGWDLVPDDIDEEGDVEMDEAEIDQEKWDALEEVAVGDVLRRNLGRIDRIKDVLPLAEYIVKRSNAQDLMLMYNVPFFAAGDVEAFLRALARANGRMKKGDQPDIEAGARILLRDWALNQFPYYSVPSNGDKSSSDDAGNSRPDMTAVLRACKGKKEMRANGRGLVRFQSGTVDQREVILDDDYTAAFEPSDDEEDDLEDDMDDDDEADEFEGDDAALEGLAEEEDEDGDIQIGSDEDEEEEEEEPAPKKRGGATAPKKVTFGALPVKESKREVAKLVGKANKGKKGGVRRSRS